MDEMDFTLKAILGIGVLLALWEITAVSFTNKKIKVKGSVPGQKVALGLFGAVWVVILLKRWGTGVGTLVTAGVILVAALLNFAIKNGLSDYGVYINGRSTSYDNIKYFDMGRQEGKYFRLRLSGLTKEIELLFGETELEQAIALLSAHGVLDMESYNAKRRAAGR